ncbi:MAG TPA: DUF4262 domain-containing protein [Blastocatellia bacterium]|nr:DUF4262 domain-containing protein [Blastocatellia bacterium]
MSEHDPRCEGGTGSEQKLLDDVAEYGWHVMKVLDQDGAPGWAYSIGLYRNFAHPEILVFGLDIDLMHAMINSIGEEARSGRTFGVDLKYPGLIEAYSCTFKMVDPVWYEVFLGFATWFYHGSRFPVLQCFWPDFDANFPWEPDFSEELRRAQPMLFHADPERARVNELLRLLDSDPPG